MVNVAVTTTVFQILSNLSLLKGQPVMGSVRFFFSFFFITRIAQEAAIADNGRQSFFCDPTTNEVHKEQCFAQYSAEMSRWMKPEQFLLVTTLILVIFWTVMIQYSFKHLAKVRKAETGSSQRERLCREYWMKFLLHVGSEAVVLSVISGLFYYTQEFIYPETYNCTLITAPVMTCIDAYHQDKPKLNYIIIIWIGSTSLLCIWIFFQQLCNQEDFIKELLAENEAGNERLEILISNH